MRTSRLFVSLLAIACALFAAPAVEAKSTWVEKTGATTKVIPGLISASTPATKSRRPKKGEMRVEKTGKTVSSLQPSDIDDGDVGPPLRRLGLRSLVIYGEQ